MKQTFTPEGVRIPVTHIDTAPCYLVNIKTDIDNNCIGVKLGFGITKHIKKPVSGELKKAGIKAPLMFLREINFRNLTIPVIEKDKIKGIKIDETELFIGDEIKPSMVFKKDALVTVTGKSKGKGFAGVVKRHRFSGGPRTHGQSDRERAPGSIGASTTPGRVYKGKRMAGRMGGETVSIQNLTVIDATETSLLVKGLIPGARGGLVVIRSVN